MPFPHMVGHGNKCIMGQGMKTQTSCASHFLEVQMLQKSIDTVRVKDFMHVFQESECVFIIINDSSFLSTFSRLLSNWKQLFVQLRALKCAFQQLSRKLSWLYVKAIKNQTCCFTKAYLRIPYILTKKGSTVNKICMYNFLLRGSSINVV